ncbi:hypothetical protein BDV33DRAFT_185130 [Aspergillus novoparasiticus]|uniref:Uncharacterized protein n=1 Tax=Aspergillus novoparasiticus TaxID=986946 RepID=A0A5N6E7G5_9EURO|nr:hypothetical protein BDV33DRAFT_185130 [Aspergillus novoparasiticus]
MDAKFPRRPNDALLLDQIREKITKEKRPLFTFLNGDRFEDLFADHPQDKGGLPSLSRGARKCERLRYLIEVYIHTKKFVAEYPEHNTIKENEEFWDNVSNPGYRQHGGMKKFAEKYGYPINQTRKVLSRGGKIRAIESELGEPAVLLLLIPVIPMLDRLSYNGARELGSQLGCESADLLSMGQTLHKKWEVYVRNLEAWLFVD